MTKIKVILILGVVFSIGMQTFTIIGLSEKESTIISDDNRSIEIPLEKINLKQSIAIESSAMALWDGLYWHQIPFKFIRSSENSLEGDQDLNESIDTETLPMNEKDILRFFIPHISSQPCADPHWWPLAQHYNLNQRTKFTFESSFDNLLEIYLYFGDSPLPNFPHLLVTNIPYGTETQNVNSSEIIDNIPIEYFTLNDITDIEKTSEKQIGGGHGASSKTVYDRGDFFDRHEFRNTGNTFQSQTQYLSPRDFINGETLIVSGTAYDDDFQRTLTVRLNGHEIIDEDVHFSFYFSKSYSQIHSYLDNEYGENELEIKLTTWTNDWYWRVDGYITSYYTAEKHFNTQKSFFADNTNKYKFYYTGSSVQEFAVDVPRGITSAKLKIYGKDYDDWSRVLKVYVNGEQVLYAYIGSAGGRKDFSKSISVTNQAKYEDELKIGIVITTYDPYQEDNHWLVYGRLETNARMDPFPDEPYEGNMWDDHRNTFLGGSTSLWHMKGNTNYFLGMYDFYVRSKSNDESNIYIGFQYYIPEGEEEEIKDAYCDGFWRKYSGIDPESYITLTSSGWAHQDLQYMNFYGSPQDTGVDYGELGWLLIDTELDILNVLVSATGHPYAVAFPLLTTIVRWGKYLEKTPVSGDRAYVSSDLLVIDVDSILVGENFDNKGSASRNSKFEFDINPGTYSFSISVSLDMNMRVLDLVYIPDKGFVYWPNYIDLAALTISYSVTIQIF